MQDKTIFELGQVCGALSRLASQVKIETAEVVGTNDHVQVITHYNFLRIIAEQVKVARESLKEIEERLSREYVPDVMRSSGIKNVTIDGIGRVSLGTRWSASMPDKEAGMQWLRENGHGGLIIETVNSSSLAAFAKELNEAGRELPSPEFKTSTMTYTSITKA